ncbi:hypothetical protein PAECIP111891_01673 [Paenibacillus allorhizoplanae]|uniref:Uncharacterized protein n=1 Tax=Paenibacillus allorhizoplanae TaxID=2905648 RepID=A0ABM9C1G7_9BACL|nr:hypothetical protein [Paenibacillus allorhizoplanae]CAH1200326.1 hypothetical protein PAECIP111891_01673 [Paenibacillus allorhizoplanae]
MTIVLYEKLPEGQLLKLGERAWDDQLIQALNVANFILVGGKEYEMIEGRLNLDLQVFELLLVKAGAVGGGSKE